ncbi:TPA: hypothetical protein DCR79_00475 [Patescibacteria group bacterium]|nr:hypothetical protein [Patescibacteria group bacterium]
MVAEKYPHSKGGDQTKKRADIQSAPPLMVSKKSEQFDQGIFKPWRDFSAPPVDMDKPLNILNYRLDQSTWPIVLIGQTVCDLVFDMIQRFLSGQSSRDVDFDERRVELTTPWLCENRFLIFTTKFFLDRQYSPPWRKR